MINYQIITKPRRIRLRTSHNLHHIVLDKFIEFNEETRMWACRAIDDRGERLLIFNHSFITTFAPDSQAVKARWDILEANELDWRVDLQILSATFNDLNIMCGK